MEHIALVTLAAAVLVIGAGTSALPAHAAEPTRAIEQLLATAQQEKRGVTLHVDGSRRRATGFRRRTRPAVAAARPR